MSTGTTAATDLFCFAPAGAGGVGYRPWRAPLSPAIRVVPVLLPGREGRGHEPLVTDVAAAVGALRAQLALPGRGTPFAFFGHSLGAILAYELTRDLQREGHPLPVCLIVSGRGAPHGPRPGPPQRGLSDAQLLREVTALGGTPPEILAHESFLTQFLPILRADLMINEAYRPAADPGTVATRMVAYAGMEDPLASPDDIAGWRRYAGGSFGLRVFRGSHFFVHEVRSAVLAAIREDVRRGSAEAAAAAPAE